MDHKPATAPQVVRPTVEELLLRNKKYAAGTHKPCPDMMELLQWTAPSTIIIACADPRCDPEDFLQGKTGEFATLRNLGGQAEISIHDVATLDSEFSFKELMIIHHTDCGASHMTKDSVSLYLKENLPQATTAEVEAFPIRIYSDIEQSVRKDLEIVRTSPYIRTELKESARGFVYDIKTGLLTPVL